MPAHQEYFIFGEEFLLGDTLLITFTCSYCSLIQQNRFDRGDVVTHQFCREIEHGLLNMDSFTIHTNFGGIAEYRVDARHKKEHTWTDY